jgi:ABC-2 type transport system ATP-binding protein
MRHRLFFLTLEQVIFSPIALISVCTCINQILLFIQFFLLLFISSLFIKFGAEIWTFTVEKGEIYGSVGVNGAGKSTTIRLLLGMLTPDKGAAYLFGEKVSPDKKELWRKVGYIVEGASAYPDLTVEENLQVTYSLRQIPGKKAIDRIIAMLKLGPHRKKKAGKLSTGNRQRLGLAKALIHEPELLILNEPTNGLDPVGIVEIRNLLLELAGKGVTVFVSSHILSEISKMAKKIGVIHEGRLIQELDRAQLEELRKRRLLVASHRPAEAKRVLIQSGLQVLENKEGNLEIGDAFAFENPEKIAVRLVEAGCPPTLLKVEEEDLESYFLRLIGISGGDRE